MLSSALYAADNTQTFFTPKEKCTQIRAIDIHIHKRSMGIFSGNLEQNYQNYRRVIFRWGKNRKQPGGGLLSAARLLSARLAR